MRLSDRILSGQDKIVVVGLGYVGMPLAVAFAKKASVIGFDINCDKVKQYLAGVDPTREVGDDEIKDSTVFFTCEEKHLQKAKFFIVAVPTPITLDKTPDLTPVENASRVVGRNLTRGSIVVYESTVYPGVTEDICVPILEAESGLVCGTDFKIGYSPERINPGDKVNTLQNIVKIVSGMDEETLDEVTRIYEMIITAGIHKASSIKVAEAAKVVENSQRDINIAFMNELAMVFDRMGIDTMEVIEAMNTKWNALKFYPGLVGGHCIGVDPYYFISQAEKLGYHSQIILSGRKINDGMGEFVAASIIKKLSLAGKVIRNARVAILGITFKENSPDTRNSKVVDIIDRLREYGIEPTVVDTEASAEDASKNYGLKLTPIEEVRDMDCIAITVAHNSFRELSWDRLDAMFKPLPNEEKVIIDIKSVLDKKELDARGYCYWRL